MPPAEPPIRIADRDGAQRLAAEVLAAIGELQAVLAAETDQVRAGRLREGLADGERKATLSARYFRGVAALKTNAVALARFAPDEVTRLREAHRGFAALVETNQTVLATARTVTESLMRGVADTLKKSAVPEVYGRRSAYAGRGTPTSAPLVLSRHL